MRFVRQIKTVMFSKWPTWKFVVFIVSLTLLVELVIAGYFLPCKIGYTREDMTIDHLRVARNGWLYDGCPQPPTNSETGSGLTNFTYNGTFIYIEERYNMGLVTNICHGLFATKYDDEPNTYVITTTGDVFLLSPFGRPRLLGQSRY
jgi:hypothetical protein